MIAKDDVIVSLSYPSRGIVSSQERTDTFAVVGTPADVAETVRRQVESWLTRGAPGPMTLHVTDRWSVIDAAEAVSRDA